jgi:hypothetical protein
VDDDSRVGQAISELEDRAPDAPEAEILERLEKVLALLPGLDDARAKRLCTGPPRLAPLYRRYLHAKEMQLAKQFLEAAAGGRALRRGEGGVYGGEAYARVRDMFERVDFGACRAFVMVGSGPLPVALLHVADETKIERLIGLDVDEASLRIAKELCERLAPTRIEMALCDGCDYDYGRADAVYVANLVAPKASVVARIVETARPGTKLIVREPTGPGIPLAERGLEPLDPRLTLLGWGPARRRYFSRHAFLERGDPSA